MASVEQGLRLRAVMSQERDSAEAGPAEWGAPSVALGCAPRPRRLGRLDPLPRVPRRPLGSASAPDRRDPRAAAQRAMGRGGAPQAGAGGPGLGAAC